MELLQQRFILSNAYGACDRKILSGLISGMSVVYFGR
jgi:hypothetical protein